MVSDRKFISEAEARRREKLEEQRERRGKFLERCPKQYVVSDLTRFNKKAVETVMGWKMSITGLLLYGYTGTGKTRTVWQLIKRLMVDDNVFPTYVKATELSTELFDTYTGSQNSTAAVVNKYKFSRLLIIDDFGKEPLSPRYLSLLYDIIDGRREMGKPMIITTNLNRPQIIERIADETISKPLILRIDECCEGVVFNEA